MEEVNITCDSRKVKPGWTFFAIRGEKIDGHDFIEDAIRRGAKKIVAEKRIQNLPPGIELEIVDDTRIAFYWDFFRKMDLDKWHCHSVGITGTNGKTSISFMIEFLLGTDRTMRLGTIGYSLAGETIPASTTTPGLEEFLDLVWRGKRMGINFLVMEVSSHALQQRRLGEYEFNVGVFTNLSRDHLDYHRDEQSYYEAKRRLFFSHLKEDGVSVVNCRDRWGQMLYNDLKKKGKNVIGIGKEVEVELRSLSLEWTIGKIKWGKDEFEMKIGLIGEYNLINAVQALISAYVLSGEEIRKLLERLENFSGVPGRMEKIVAKERLVFIDYAHTPDGLEHVLTTLKKLKGDRNLLCVFGCGGDRDMGKRPMMGQIADRLADIVVITSDNPRNEDPEKIIEEIVDGIPKFSRLRHIVEPDRYRAIRLALEIAHPGDIVLVAGKGHEDYQIIGDRKYHFSDKEVVLEWANSG